MSENGDAPVSEPQDREAWRALVREAAIEPDVPIIDPHHHVWPQAPMAGAESWDRDDLFAYMTGEGHRIVATVIVESGIAYRTQGASELAPVGETEFAETIAKEAARRGGLVGGAVSGIVAAADMMLGARVGAVLDAHIEASPRLRGIRPSIACDPDLPYEIDTRPGMMAEPAFREAVAALTARDLCLEVWVMHPQLAEVADLAAACPDTTFVIDHLGSPMGVGRFAQDRRAAFADWRAGMAALAERPNVVVKLGGLNMPLTDLCADYAAREPWTSEKMAQVQREHILAAIDLFGPQRCMFESNFPVDRILTSGTVLWNAFKRMVADFTPEEKHEMFFAAADRVYRLDAAARL